MTLKARVKTPAVTKASRKARAPVWNAVTSNMACLSGFELADRQRQADHDLVGDVALGGFERHGEQQLPALVGQVAVEQHACLEEPRIGQGGRAVGEDVLPEGHRRLVDRLLVEPERSEEHT